MNRSIRVRFIAVGMMALLFSSCRPSVIHHDENKAAVVAVRFAKAAFVDNDYGSASAYLGDEAQSHISQDKFADTMKEMHPTNRPTVVTAVEFEPIPGQKSMNILLHGQNGEEEFHYRILMVGTSLSGYGVHGFLRGTGPYSSRMTRPLSKKPSTESIDKKIA